MNYEWYGCLLKQNTQVIIGFSFILREPCMRIWRSPRQQVGFAILFCGAYQGYGVITLPLPISHSLDAGSSDYCFPETEGKCPSVPE